MGISEINVTLDTDKVKELLLWNTRRAIFHEIGDKKGKSYLSINVCIHLNMGDDYLVKEAITRIKRQCAWENTWIVDEDAFGAWVSKYAENVQDW